MDIIESVKTCFKKYATFSGRASRSEFWFFYLAYWIVTLVLVFISFSLMAIWNLATIIPFYAVSARRLHDIDKSGWFQLFYLIPLVGVIILIVWFATKSDPGKNRYGPKPAK